MNIFLLQFAFVSDILAIIFLSKLMIYDPEVQTYNNQVGSGLILHRYAGFTLYSKKL